MQSTYFGVRVAAHVSLALAACGGATRIERTQGSAGTGEGGLLVSGGFTGAGGSGGETRGSGGSGGETRGSGGSGGETRGSGGSAGSAVGGMRQAGGTPSTGGRPGSGGQRVDGGGDASPGTTSIKIEIHGSAPHCFASNCGEGPAISISDSEGHMLDLVGSCGSLSCESCSPRRCPGTPCQPQTLPPQEAWLVWDGSNFVGSTCGIDAPCIRRSYATPGRYTATFCATEGMLVTVDGGPSRCVTSGPMKCIELPFDFPSSVPVVGSLGCSYVDDACHDDSDCCSGPDNGVNGRKLHCVGTAGGAYCEAATP